MATVPRSHETRFSAPCGYRKFGRPYRVGFLTTTCRAICSAIGTASSDQTAIEDCEPSQPQQELRARRELHVERYRHRPDVDVRLVKTVEQDEAIGARTIELPGDVSERREERRDFDGDRDSEDPLQLRGHVE